MSEEPAPVVGRRVRHRPILGVSGIVLFACMFLPALRTCHEPTYPTEVPALLPPYFLGLAFAACALIASERTLRAVAGVIRVVFAAFAVLGVAMLVYAPPLGVVELSTAVVLLAILGGGADEGRLATAVIVSASLQCCWFLIIAAPPDGMIGGQLSLLSSIGLLVGGVLWRIGLAPPPPPPRPPPPPKLPRAIVVR
jgi:hypothetical protein